MLSDLPEVNSFSVAEELDYKSEPQTPYQVRQAKLAVTVGAEAVVVGNLQACQGCRCSGLHSQRYSLWQSLPCLRGPEVQLHQ